MFDMLTTGQLFHLHTSLYFTHRKLHDQIVGPDYPYPPLIDPLSDTWAVVSAACSEVSETMHAVYAELARRDREAVNA